MHEFNMKIELDGLTLFRKVSAENPRQAIEITMKNLFWIVGEDDNVLSISVYTMDGIPMLIEFDNIEEASFTH